MSHLDSEMRLQLFSAEFPKADDRRKIESKPRKVPNGFSLARAYMLVLAFCAVVKAR